MTAQSALGLIDAAIDAIDEARHDPDISDRAVSFLIAAAGELLNARLRQAAKIKAAAKLGPQGSIAAWHPHRKDRSKHDE